MCFRNARSRDRRRSRVLLRDLACCTLLGVLVSSCTFERRNGPDAVEVGADSVTSPGTTGAESPADLAEAGALQTVALFRASVATGDLSSALALVDRDATLVDELAGAASEAATRGELLLELRRRHAEGIGLEAIESRVAFLGTESALVTSLVAVLQEDADGIGEVVGRLQETVFLVATEQGWRIRHLHRSIAAGQIEIMNGPSNF